MAIRLKVQEDKVRLKVGQGEGATLNAVREARPILINDYDDLINKPSINGVELEGNLTTEDLHIEAGVTSWNGQTGDVVYTPPEAPVQSVNGEVGDVILNAADVGALPDTTPIPVDADLVHKAGAETITGSKNFTNGVEISRPTSGAILKLSSSAADTNFILERTGGSQCVLESGSAVGLFGTKSNHPLQVRTNYVNRMTIGIDGSVELATAPAASSNNNQVATTKWVNDKGYAEASDIPTKTSDLTNDSDFVNVTQAASAAPVQSVNGQSGAVVLDADDVGALPDTTVIPTKTSDLTNDSGFVNASGAANAAPVQSVNGATGAVVLGASDVGALADDTKYAASPAVGGSATFANGIHYGRVDETSTATAFTATIPGITSYYDGLTVILYNGKVTSASGYTININGLGAYGTYSNMALGNEHTPTAPTRDTTIFNVNYAMILTYCSDIGGQGVAGWICYRGYDANTNTIGYQVRTNSYSLPMKSVTYRYRLLFTSADGNGFVPATNSTSTNATATRAVCQDKIDPFGSIVYYGTTASVAAGSRPSTAYLWEQYALSLGYSFNRTGAALTLTPWRPVYVKCAPQSDGSAIIDADTPYVQELPTTADGKIYIFLGVAYNATNIELNLNHSVYYIDANARKRIWTGEDISI